MTKRVKEPEINLGFPVRVKDESERAAIMVLLLVHAAIYSPGMIENNGMPEFGAYLDQSVDNISRRVRISKGFKFIEDFDENDERGPIIWLNKDEKKFCAFKRDGIRVGFSFNSKHKETKPSLIGRVFGTKRWVTSPQSVRDVLDAVVDMQISMDQTSNHTVKSGS